MPSPSAAPAPADAPPHASNDCPDCARNEVSTHGPQPALGRNVFESSQVAANYVQGGIDRQMLRLFFNIASRRLLSPELKSNYSAPIDPGAPPHGPQYTGAELDMNDLTVRVTGRIVETIMHSCGNNFQSACAVKVRNDVYATLETIDRMTPEQLEAYRHSLAKKADKLDAANKLLQARLAYLDNQRATILNETIASMLGEFARNAAAAPESSVSVQSGQIGAVSRAGRVTVGAGASAALVSAPNGIAVVAHKADFTQVDDVIAPPETWPDHSQQQTPASGDTAAKPQ